MTVRRKKIYMNIEPKQINDYRWEIRLNGQTLGWVHRWFKADQWNDKPKTELFSAKPLGLSEAKYDCQTLASAVVYILGYHEDVIGKPE